jgi:23S rRNA-/tRNA-specific pseudouridylate synthase
LDFGPSGILLVAQDASTQVEATQALERAHKLYQCVSEILDKSRLEQRQGECDLPLRRLDPKEKGKQGQVMAVCEDRGHPHAKEAWTHWKVLDDWQLGTSHLALLDVQILTGRTHQIRTHLAHLGLPLWKDPQYNPQANSRGSQGDLFLHARELRDFVWKGRVVHICDEKDLTTELRPVK